MMCAKRAKKKQGEEEYRLASKHQERHELRTQVQQSQQLQMPQDPTLEHAVASASKLRVLPALSTVHSAASGEEVPVLQALREGVSLLTVYVLHCSMSNEAMVHPQSRKCCIVNCSFD
jgi:hypothetical protein